MDAHATIQECIRCSVKFRHTPRLYRISLEILAELLPLDEETVCYVPLDSGPALKTLNGVQLDVGVVDMTEGRADAKLVVQPASVHHWSETVELVYEVMLDAVPWQPVDGYEVVYASHGCRFCSVSRTSMADTLDRSQ